MTALRRGGVIAAGEGTRLGDDVPKPLRRVGGRSLLGRTLERFARAGICDVVVIIRADQPRLQAWVEVNHPDVELLVKTTRASSESFREVLQGLGHRRALISTVDSVLPAAAFLRFVREAEQAPDDALVLAVTRHVDDEKPLWAAWDEAGRLTSLGRPCGDGATAGMYVVPAAFMEAAGDLPLDAPLRMLLGRWVEARQPTHAVDVGTLIDVDRPEDLEAAEALLETEEEEGAR